MFSEHSIVLHQQKRSTQVKIRRVTKMGEIDFSTQKWHLYNSHPRIAVASKPKVLVHRQRSCSQLTIELHSSLRHRKTRKTNPYFSKNKRQKTCRWWNRTSLGLTRTQIQLTKSYSLPLEIRRPARRPKPPPHIENSKTSPQHENLRIRAYQRRPHIDERKIIAPAAEEAFYKSKEHETLTLIFHEQPELDSDER